MTTVHCLTSPVAVLLTRASCVAAGLATFLLATPAAAEAAAPPAAVAIADDALLQALEAAQSGDIGPAECLLPQTQSGSPERALLEAHSAAALLRQDEALAALQRYFALGDVHSRRLQHARRLGAGMAFFAGRYLEAKAFSSAFLAGDEAESEPDRQGLERLHAIAGLLSNAPQQRIDSRGSGAPVPFRFDKVGLPRAGVATAAGAEEAVLDTGANLSVASRSAAARLGLRMLEGDAAVGNSLGGGVDVQLAIADRLELAGAVLRNVVFLVMEDEALTFPVPGGYRIDVIVGLPVLSAIRRVTFGPDETFRVAPLEPRPAGPANLRIAGSNLYAVAQVAGQEYPFFVDTGANASSLSTRFATAHPHLAGAPAEVVRRAGAGGGAVVRNNRVEQVSLRIADVETIAPSLRVETEAVPGEEGRYGVLGADVFRMFDTITLDFDRMRLDATKLASGPTAP